MTLPTPDQVTQLARLLIKQFEGCRLQAYQDIGGIPTIGYGQTGPAVKLGLTWTQEQADQALNNTLTFLWGRIDQDICRDLLPQQGAAMLSLAYNIGLSALERSTLWGMVQSGQFGPAADQFLRFDRVRLQGGTYEVIAGLQARRKAERDLFLSSLV